MYRSESREKLREFECITEQVKKCTNCELHQTRNNVVVGSGNLDSRIVLMGEAPGRKEDESGLPFVGAAGKLLDTLLASAGLKREDILITNVVQCRPPKNRRPKKSEIKACEHFLVEKIAVLRPKIIAPMGNSSLSYILNHYGKEKAVIGDIHGQPFVTEEPWGKVTVFPLYHPAAAIYNRKLIPQLEEDMRKLAELQVS